MPALSLDPAPKTRPSSFGGSWRLLPARILAWALLTALACAVVYARAHIAEAPMPSPRAQRWALSALAQGCQGRALSPPPADARTYAAARGVVALGWRKGRVRFEHVGARLVETVQEAAAKLAAARAAGGPPCSELRFTLSLDRGRASLLHAVPILRALAVVPLVEGLTAEHEGRRAYVTPDELLAAGFHDHVRTPIPDLAFGMDLDGAVARLAKRLGTDPAALLASGRVERYRAGSVLPAPYPSRARPEPSVLARSAREGARFLLRHMAADGRYTYIYRGAKGDASPTRAYSMPRHAGTTYFLAQADRVLGMPEAREGALRALRYLARERLRRCGSPDRLCIADGGEGDMGATALTAVAAAEILRKADEPEVRAMLVGLTAFIRAMQRPDGELMHAYDLARDRPIDVQLMYYSGEAAYALLRSHAVLKDERNLVTARKLMRHLTGAGWSFFGSRYFYGEEHWTCQAVAQAGALFGAHEGDPGVDFCLRWLAFNRELQYGPGQTPWPVAGAIGVGPLLVPRVTTVSSRTETGAMLYPVLRKAGIDAEPVRRQVEASLGFLLRTHWSPGPAHLLADPEDALGGMPGSPASLDVRNDFVQHAGSAMLLWLEALGSAAASSPASSTPADRAHGE